MVLKQRSPGGTWRRRFSSDMDSVRDFEHLKSSEDVTTSSLSLKLRQREDTLVEKPSKMYSAPMMSRSETTLAGSSTLELNEKAYSAEGGVKPTVRLVNEKGSVGDVRRAGSSDSVDSSASEEAEWRPRVLSPVVEVTSREERSQATQENVQREEEDEVPRLSIFLTIVTLVVVTISAFSGTGGPNVLTRIWRCDSWLSLQRIVWWKLWTRYPSPSASSGLGSSCSLL